MPDRTHVLVVDDEREFRTAMGALLASEGFRVSTAGSGDEALQGEARF
jgi:CheY-like chemotaxis protein